MYIFLFWPFKVIGFILSLYFLAKIGSTIFPNLALGNLGMILMAFAIPIVGLFWIDFDKFYFKFVHSNDHELDNKKVKKRKKEKKKKIKLWK